MTSCTFASKQENGAFCVNAVNLWFPVKFPVKSCKNKHRRWKCHIENLVLPGPARPIFRTDIFLTARGHNVMLVPDLARLKRHPLNSKESISFVDSAESMTCLDHRMRSLRDAIWKNKVCSPSKDLNNRKNNRLAHTIARHDRQRMMITDNSAGMKWLWPANRD